MVVGGPKELNYVGVFHVVEEATLLLELSPSCHHTWVIGLEEDGVQEFGSTETLAPHGFADHSIGPTAKGVISA